MARRLRLASTAAVVVAGAVFFAPIGIDVLWMGHAAAGDANKVPKPGPMVVMPPGTPLNNKKNDDLSAAKLKSHINSGNTNLEALKKATENARRKGNDAQPNVIKKWQKDQAVGQTESLKGKNKNAGKNATGLSDTKLKAKKSIESVATQKGKDKSLSATGQQQLKTKKAVGENASPKDKLKSKDAVTTIETQKLKGDKEAKGKQKDKQDSSTSAETTSSPDATDKNSSTSATSGTSTETSIGTNTEAATGTTTDASTGNTAMPMNPGAPGHYIPYGQTGGTDTTVGTDTSGTGGGNTAMPVNPGAPGQNQTLTPDEIATAWQYLGGNGATPTPEGWQQVRANLGLSPGDTPPTRQEFHDGVGIIRGWQLASGKDGIPTPDSWQQFRQTLGLSPGDTPPTQAEVQESAGAWRTLQVLGYASNGPPTPEAWQQVRQTLGLSPGDTKPTPDEFQQGLDTMRAEAIASYQAESFRSVFGPQVVNPGAPGQPGPVAGPPIYQPAPGALPPGSHPLDQVRFPNVYVDPTGNVTRIQYDGKTDPFFSNMRLNPQGQMELSDSQGKVVSVADLQGRIAPVYQPFPGALPDGSHLLDPINQPNVWGNANGLTYRVLSDGSAEILPRAPLPADFHVVDAANNVWGNDGGVRYGLTPNGTWKELPRVDPTTGAMWTPGAAFRPVDPVNHPNVWVDEAGWNYNASNGAWTVLGRKTDSGLWEIPNGTSGYTLSSMDPVTHTYSLPSAAQPPGTPGTASSCGIL